MKDLKNVHTFAKYNDNWADEIDFEGFSVFSPEAWEEYKTLIGKIETSFEFMFRTNEYNEYEDGKSLLNKIQISYIDESTALVIKSNFGDSYGFFPELWRIVDEDEV